VGGSEPRCLCELSLPSEVPAKNSGYKTLEKAPPALKAIVPEKLCCGGVDATGGVSISGGVIGMGVVDKAGREGADI
jgi:hypothetical protein